MGCVFRCGTKDLFKETILMGGVFFCRLSSFFFLTWHHPWVWLGHRQTVRYVILFTSSHSCWDMGAWFAGDLLHLIFHSFGGAVLCFSWMFWYSPGVPLRVISDNCILKSHSRYHNKCNYFSSWNRGEMKTMLYWITNQNHQIEENFFLAYVLSHQKEIKGYNIFSKH